MTLKTIYIARHGYRSNWLPPPHAPPPTGIDSDPALAPHGEDQAVQLGHYIASLGSEKAPQMIISSPFYRCIQTAQPLSKLLNLPICLERGIGEWFKVERDLHPVPGDYELLSKFFDNLDSQYKPDSHIVPSERGETEEEIFARCQIFLQKFIPFVNEHYPQVERVLLVTHAATKIALGMALLGYSGPRDLLKNDHVLENEIRLRAGACSLDRFDLDTRASEWLLSMNGNVEFLTEGEEMNWSFEYGFEAGSDDDIKARAAKAKQQESEEFDEVYVTLEIPSNQQIVASNVSNSSQYYNRVLIEELSKTNAGTGPKLEHAKESNIPPEGGDAKNGTGGGNGQFNNIYASNTIQVSGLDTESPLVMINQQLYQGEYRKLNGTELIVNDIGDVVAKTKDRMLLHQSEFVSKPDAEKDEASNELKLRQEILASLPANVAKSKNQNLIDKLVLARKLELGLPIN